MSGASHRGLDVGGRGLAISCALLYFVIGKIEFEPRLALGSISLNQVVQLGVLASLAFLPWCGRLQAVSRSRALALTATLTLALALWAVNAENTAYAPEKSLGFAGLVLPTCVLLAALLRGAGDIRWLLAGLALVGTAMMLLGIGLLVTGTAPPRLAVFGGGGNVFARMLGAAVIVIVGADLRLRGGRLRAYGWLLPGFAVALLFAGSKTVVLALGISIAVLGWQRRSRRLALGALVGTALFATSPMYTHSLVRDAYKDRGEVRMFRLPDTADPRGSYGTRLQYYRASVGLLRRFGWGGTGTGDWAMALHLPSGRRYPHNLVLELGCELGVAGLGLLLLTLLLAARSARSLTAVPGDGGVSGTLLALFVFWFVNAQLSGDVFDNRWIWLTLLLQEIVVEERRRTRAPATAAWSTAPGLELSAELFP